jgi:hypothetical protein
MHDLRYFKNLIRVAKDNFPEKTALIESIEDKFNSLFESITYKHKLALRRYPLQYVNKIYQGDGGWTSQLHIWAEEGVREILDLDPVLLSFKNSYGDTVLMCFVKGATGSLTDKMDYDSLRMMLGKTFWYTDSSVDKNGMEVQERKDALAEPDVFGQRPLDYLIDIAYAQNEYADDLPDEELQRMLEEYVSH